MTPIKITNFGGLIPKVLSRDLPTNAAEEAINCDLSSGELDGLPTPTLAKDLTLALDPLIVRRAFRIPDPTGSGGADVWVPFPDVRASLVRSPLAADPQHRYYWTVGGANSDPFWATYAMLVAGTTPYILGTITPNVAPTVPSITGGTTDGSIPLESRAYCYTYINAFGEESAPSPPSSVSTGPPDATWNIGSLPGTAPTSIPNYPPVTGLRLYRTVTGAQTGAQFYEVWTFIYPGSPPPNPYPDVLLDEFIINNPVLPSASWLNPPRGLDGLTALPGGMLVGFIGNTVYFCEPNRPHAWPAAYAQSLHWDIVALAVWQQNLTVLTKGYPATGAGNSPTNFIFTQVKAPEPCVARGSVITDLMGVYYASKNGLIFLNYYGMQNQSLSLVTRKEWLNKYNAAGIIACRHRAQFLATTGVGGKGFLIDYSEQRLGMMDLSTFASVDCVWNDEYTGDAYMCSHEKIYLWDDPAAASLTYRWRSKQFYLDTPVSMGAAHVSLDPAILSPPAVTTPATGNGDTTLVMPAGVHCVFNLYAGPDGQHLIGTWNLNQVRNIFRLPSGFKSFDWQIEIVSNVGVRMVKLARTMKELKGGEQPSG